MSEFICVAPDEKGNYQRAMYCFGKSLKFYRSSYPEPYKGLRLKKFKVKKNAQFLCDNVNAYYKDNFIVIEHNQQKGE